jgi:hypothetical protein
VALPVAAIAWILLPAGDFRPLVVVLVGLCAAMASRWLPAPPLANERLMAEHLDRLLPELEDSTGLVIRSVAELSSLERLQRERILPLLERAVEEHLWPRSQVVRSLQFLVVGVLLTTLVGAVRWSAASIPLAGGEMDRMATTRSLVEPFQQVEVEIEPPAYTGRPSRQQRLLEVTAEEGSSVRWRLPGAAEEVELVFADGERLDFATDAAGKVAEIEATENRVYHLASVGEGAEARSPYARLEVIPDLPPRLEILEPTARVTTVAKEEGRMALTIEAEDDYGLEALELVTTLARGSGELVEFRQRRTPLHLDDEVTKARQQKVIDFRTAELEAGAELYFYVEARDNRRPQPNVSRTPTYILRLPGEALETSDLGAGLPVVLPPEYFRSQRQLILDTEALIAAEPELSSTEFARRSESLGFDQRALRMRYGILLGEEFESGRPLEAGEEADHEDEESPIAGLPAELFHLHDSAEMATFFTNEIRTQLKRVLAEMWGAEGELRVLRPRDALAYEYRALELLKDLQHRSRIYVQKVGFETPPLEPETMRLTGELEDIDSRHRTVERTAPDPLVVAVGKLLNALDLGRGLEEEVTPEATAVVRSHLAQLAVDDSEVLPALEALDRWARGETLAVADRQALERALWRLTPPPDAGPGRVAVSPDPLAQLYRARLSAKEDW